ncbi:MAG TPA: protein-L-isoaspartate(D-aspartate) O-methyltransferase [Cyclobacteriaceae bacterium]|mgnify:CR=1 FL=1|nr:protein-L-isoaspartate(D-aspartate) O-methyltransferase [Cyclobacteriaceae bacterium]
MKLISTIAKIFYALILINTPALLSAQEDYATLRKRMVDEQFKGRGIKNPQVLAAMMKVERHLFVPSDIAYRAYVDGAQPIGYGQTISQPYIVAFMTEALAPQADYKVLEIGTGSGYQAAIIGEICKEVYTIEIVPELAESSTKLLAELKYKNIFVKQGDGYLGWEEHAPFDVIIVTCSPSHVPEPLQAQLKEGGRMMIPVGSRTTQELILLTKKDGKLRRSSRLPVIFVPMKDAEDKRYD